MNISTINELISLGKEFKISNNTLSFKELLVNSNGEKYVINLNNIIDRYYDILLEQYANSDNYYLYVERLGEDKSKYYFHIPNH